MKRRTRDAESVSLILPAGDFVMLLLFATGGNEEHRLGLNVLELLRLAFPYLAGWLLAAWLTGAFRIRAVSSFPRAWGVTTLTALMAHPAALLLRYFLYGKSTSAFFAWAGFLLILAFVLAWRLFCTLVCRWKRQALKR
jgi:biotin transporter BioY